MGGNGQTVDQLTCALSESQAHVERLVIENAQLRDEAGHAGEIADSLQAASLALTKTFDLDSILENLLDYLGDLVPYDSASIFLLEKDSHLVARAARGYERWLDSTGTEVVGAVSFDTGQSPRHQALVTTQKSLVIPDIRQYPSWEHVASSLHVRNWMGVPLVAGGRTIGLYSLDKTEPGFFTSEHVRLAEALAAQAAIAIQNALQFHEAQRELAERQQAQQAEREQRVLAEALSEIAALLNRSLDFDDVLERILTHVERVVPSDGATMLLIRGDEAEITHVRARHVSLQGTCLPYKELPSFRNAIDTGHPVAIHDVQAYEQWLRVPSTSWIRSNVTAAFGAEGQTIGFLCLDWDAPNAFSAEDVERLQAFADQAGVAARNAHLFTSVQKARQTAETLRAAYLALTQSLDLGSICERLLDYLRQLVPYDSATIFLLEDGKTLTAHAVRGYQRWSDSSAALSVSFDLEPGSTMHTIVSTQESILIPDTDLHASWVHVPSAEHVRCYLGVPMLVGDKVIGLCSLDSTEPGSLSQEDVKLAESLAAQAAFAIENARLFTEAENQKRYSESLVQNSPAAIVSVDGAGKVMSWNPAAAELFGYSRTEALGRELDALVATTPDMLEEAKAISQEAIDGIRVNVVAQRSRQDGTRVDVDISSVPVQVEGQDAGYVVIYHDITDLKKAEEELREAKAEAEAANEAKSRFLASVSHELRTPLTSILGFTKLIEKRLRERVFPMVQAGDRRTQRAIRQVTENVKIISTEGERLTTLINEVLDLAKIEAGKVEWREESLAVPDLVERAAASTQALFEQKGLHLIKDVAGDLPGIVGDEDRLLQVLINLFSNAVKFTDEGSVTCRVRRIDGALEVSVVDTGVGIAECELPIVFEPFKQAGDTLSDRPQGTGLGLPISKEIVEHHGGRIRVESELGRGTTVMFTLPASRLSPRNR
jgi:PAS domain S-box-containing protein